MMKTARHREIANSLYAAIQAGEFPAGSRLPSEHELAERFGVARGTIRQALAALRASGILISRRGARGLVLADRRAQSFTELISFSAWARAQGETPGGRVVELTRREATAVDSDRLGVPVGETVFALVRVRLLSGTPVMIERTTFPEHLGALVATIDLERGSIYEELAEHQVLFAHASHTIEALAATSEDGQLLQLPRRAPLLRDVRRSTGPDGLALEWSDDRYRGDVVTFALENSSSLTSAGRLLDAEPLGSAA